MAGILGKIQPDARGGRVGGNGIGGKALRVQPEPRWRLRGKALMQAYGFPQRRSKVFPLPQAGMCPCGLGRQPYAKRVAGWGLGDSFERCPQRLPRAMVIKAMLALASIAQAHSSSCSACHPYCQASTQYAAAAVGSPRSCASQASNSDSQPASV